MTAIANRHPSTEIAPRPMTHFVTRLVLILFAASISLAAANSTAQAATPATYTYYQVVAQHSGKCLDVANASTAHAADVIQGTCWGGTNQQWYLRPVGSGYYEVIARHSGKCLDVANASTAHAANVIQGTCWGGTNQHWRFF